MFLGHFQKHKDTSRPGVLGSAVLEIPLHCLLPPAESKTESKMDSKEVQDSKKSTEKETEPKITKPKTTRSSTKALEKEKAGLRKGGDLVFEHEGESLNVTERFQKESTLNYIIDDDMEQGVADSKNSKESTIRKKSKSKLLQHFSTFTAFYADVVHEITPVVKGARVSISFYIKNDDPERDSKDLKDSKKNVVDTKDNQNLKDEKDSKEIYVSNRPEQWKFLENKTMCSGVGCKRETGDCWIGYRCACNKILPRTQISLDVIDNVFESEHKLALNPPISFYHENPHQKFIKACRQESIQSFLTRIGGKTLNDEEKFKYVEFGPRASLGKIYWSKKIGGMESLTNSRAFSQSEFFQLRVDELLNRLKSVITPDYGIGKIFSIVY